LADPYSIKNLSDIGVVSLYKESGDQALVGELFQRYTHLVFGVCRKYLRQEEDARDATVEVFEQLLTKLKEHEISNFKSWLYSVAKNHCLMKLRGKKNHVEWQENMGENVESGDELHLEEALGKDAQLNYLEEAIQHLSDAQRTCIDLFYLKELSYQEIIKQTGFTFKEVKSFIQNGKRNLKIMLKEKYEPKAS